MFTLGNGVIKFNGLNYVEWSRQIKFQLGVLDLYLAIVLDEKLAAITKTSTDDEHYHCKASERFNSLSLKLMQMMMAENVKPSMPKMDNARKYMMKEYS